MSQSRRTEKLTQQRRWGARAVEWTGLENRSDHFVSQFKEANYGDSGECLGALLAHAVSATPELAGLIATWPRLSEAAKKQVLETVVADLRPNY